MTGTPGEKGWDIWLFRRSDIVARLEPSDPTDPGRENSSERTLSGRVGEAEGACWKAKGLEADDDPGLEDGKTGGREAWYALGDTDTEGDRKGRWPNVGVFL